MATFSNKATLIYNGGATESNTVTGTYLETLSVTKTALIDQYTDDSQIVYAISLVNTGVSPFTGLTVIDDLGAYPFGTDTLYPLAYVAGSLLYYVNGALQPTPTVAATQPLTITGISVPADGNAMLIYVADVTSTAPLDVDGEILNTVTVSGGGLTEPLTATEIISTLDAPRLTITKSLSPIAVPENGSITYTFIIGNTGNTAAVATDNLSVTDTFDPALTITSVTLNGAPLTLGTDYTYDETTGAFATTPGLITVPAATYTQEPDGTIVTNPGNATLIVVGTI